MLIAAGVHLPAEQDHLRVRCSADPVVGEHDPRVIHGRRGRGDQPEVEAGGVLTAGRGGEQPQVVVGDGALDVRPGEHLELHLYLAAEAVEKPLDPHGRPGGGDAGGGDAGGGDAGGGDAGGGDAGGGDRDLDATGADLQGPGGDP